jgi:molybdopterin-guanine dinucleotide biosynthesis protein A
MGRPKAWLPVGDEVMLQRVVRVLRAALSPVVVVAAPGQDVPELPAGVTIARDEIEGKGPLGGLSAGLAGIAERADAVYLSACDVPFLTAEFVTRISSTLTSEFDIVVPDVGGYKHPLAAVYRTTVAGEVAKLLAADRLRPVFLFDAVRTRVLTEAELPDVESLRNVNTPDEYLEVLREVTLQEEERGRRGSKPG